MPKRRHPPPPRGPAAGEADLPSLIELERFTTASMNQWAAAAKRLDTLNRALYFGLEPLRQKDSARLVEAVRSGMRNDNQTS